MSTPEGSFARWRINGAIKHLATALGGAQKPLADLQALRHARDDVIGAIDLLSEAARRSGATYAEIGRALDISTQAAHQAGRRRAAEQAERVLAKTWRLPPNLPQRRPRAASGE